MPTALAGDRELRWRVAERLAGLGALPDAQLDRLAADDPSATGRLHLLRARARRPDPRAKQQAWESLVADAALSNHELMACAEGIWEADDPALVRPYAERYFTDLPALADRLSGMALGQLAVVAYPLPVVSDDLVRLAEQALARDDLTPHVRRAIVDRTSVVREALAARAAFPAPTA